MYSINQIEWAKINGKYYLINLFCNFIAFCRISEIYYIKKIFGKKCVKQKEFKTILLHVVVKEIGNSGNKD